MPKDIEFFARTREDERHRLRLIALDDLLSTADDVEEALSSRTSLFHSASPSNAPVVRSAHGAPRTIRNAVAELEEDRS
jgi:hypothetical protein